MLLKIERKPYSSTYPPLGSGGQVDFQFQEKRIRRVYNSNVIVVQMECCLEESAGFSFELNVLPFLRKTKSFNFLFFLEINTQNSDTKLNYCQNYNISTWIFKSEA